MRKDLRNYNIYTLYLDLNFSEKQYYVKLGLSFIQKQL